MLQLYVTEYTRINLKITVLNNFFAYCVILGGLGDVLYFPMVYNTFVLVEILPLSVATPQLHYTWKFPISKCMLFDLDQKPFIKHYSVQDCDGHKGHVIMCTSYGGILKRQGPYKSISFLHPPPLFQSFLPPFSSEK